MGPARSLRPPETIFLCYFGYTAALASILQLPRAILGGVVTLLCVAALFAFLIWLESRHRAVAGVLRDWIPLGLVIVAYREMDWFTRIHPHTLESGWQAIDRALLGRYGLRTAIEAAGWPVPLYLEMCYVLVYATGFIMLGVVYAERRRDAVDRVLSLYLIGTLLAYALFPFFPSDPPRLLFHEFGPGITTPVRTLNLWLVNGGGIHSSVFPSAHVSAAFSAAFALLLFLPERRWVGCVMLWYASSVAIATVYGRYHYVVDAVAGVAVSVAAALAVLLFLRFIRTAESG